VVDQSLVNVASTKVAVPCGRLDGQLAFPELDDCDLVVAVADVNEDDSPGLLFWAGKISLCDAVAEGSRSGVVDEPQALEASDIG
jgi:hypothetical protein